MPRIALCDTAQSIVPGGSENREVRLEKEKTLAGGVSGAGSALVNRSAQIVPHMYDTAQNLLRRRVILKTVKFSAKAIAQNVNVHADKGSVDYIDVIWIR